MANPAIGDYGSTAGTIGLESRTSILPVPSIPDSAVSIYGPEYSFSDNVPEPGQVGIYQGETITSVLDSAGGAMAYIDIITYGSPTTGFTQGKPFSPLIRPLGVRTFVRTGLICANGAEMWDYIDGVPKGTLAGLAPGITQDAKAALNPVPIMSAIFGSGFPICKQVTRPVGDQNGNLKNPAGKWYMENPELVVGGQQTRWVKDTESTISDTSKMPKTHCADGFLKTSHRDQDCAKELLSKSVTGFVNYKDPDDAIEMIKMIFLATGVLAAVCIAHRYLSKK
jgi:hypothetical protein